MRFRYVLMLLMMVMLLGMLSGCVPGDGAYTEQRPAGFFWGIWHGWIAPVSLLWGLFNPNIRIYEPINTGWVYDLGFYVSIISGFGGLSLFRRKNKRNR